MIIMQYKDSNLPKKNHITYVIEFHVFMKISKDHCFQVEKYFIH